MDIEEAAASADAASSSAGKQSFLYSAEDEGVPELSVPRSPSPPPAAGGGAAATAAETAVEASFSVEVGAKADQGRELVEREGVGGFGGGGSRKNQVSEDL